MDTSAQANENPQSVLNVKEEQDPEVLAVRSLLKLLEKASKSHRTYGASNPVAQKFFGQFYDDLSNFLEEFHVLGLLVQRSALLFKGENVYEAEHQRENLAFKLYADGIRELTFHESLSKQDLFFFLESLWENQELDTSDDDIVTRLWEKNLSTIVVVTAEEIMQASGLETILAARDSGTLDSPVSTLKNVNETERSRSKEEEAGGNEKGKGQGKSLSVIGYEVSPEEMESLSKEVQDESTRNNAQYILDMLSAIIQCETSPNILKKLLEIFDHLLSSLTIDGKWIVLNTIITLLQDVHEFRNDLLEDHKKQISHLLESIGNPDRIKEVEKCLNTNTETSTDGLLEYLLHIRQHAVPSLCMLLGNLELETHRQLVLEALSILAKDNPDPIIRGLTDRRDQYVQDLLSLVGMLKDDRYVPALEKLMQHKQVQIRKEALRLLGELCPGGDGSKLVSYVTDPETSIRLTALSVLTKGSFHVTIQDWDPILSDKGLLERPTIEKRGIFKALPMTAGEEAIPYLTSLLTERSWFKRKKKDEVAVLAVNALRKIGSSAAIEALEAGLSRKNPVVQQACSSALRALSKSSSPSEE